MSAVSSNVSWADRFRVRYQIKAQSIPAATELAEMICLEQTVEVPNAVVPDGFIRDHILGRIEHIEQVSETHVLAEISYASELVLGDFSNLLNVIFGNSSIKKGLRVLDIQLSQNILDEYIGPRFGLAGLRQQLNVPQGPLLLSAIKPIGLSAQSLGELCERFALAGMDLIKDDHNLADQKWAPFLDRVKACVAGVRRANEKTGRQSCFVPNITGSTAGLRERALRAQDFGAGAVMVAPAMLGYGAVQELAMDSDFSLPIISHPAFAGANVIAPDTGFSHGFYFGSLQRLFGVDAVIYPNAGGRFGFSELECAQIRDRALLLMGHFNGCCPAPGGGMTLDRVPAMRSLYGDDVMYLMGGALLGDPRGLDMAVKALRAAVGRDI